MRLALEELLLSESLCGSVDEAGVIADLVIGEIGIEARDNDNSSSFNKNNIHNYYQEQRIEIEQAFESYLGVTQAEATRLVTELYKRLGTDADNPHNGNLQRESFLDEHNKSEDNYVVDDEEQENDNSEDDLEEGQCMLCDRHVLLTKHHLIPKSTWPKIQTRLTNAAVHKEEGDESIAIHVLGDGLEHLYPFLAADKSVIRSLLNFTCSVCRPCHSAVHRSHDNMELALSYNTVDKLFGDKKVYKFCKWNSTQRPGKYKSNRK